ncbi:MAG: hypothetical protein GX621_02080 [Pirellulaceae bacterium]|nr:hypothetical protein [Pirellulaceae bacterium]
MLAGYVMLFFCGCVGDTRETSGMNTITLPVVVIDKKERDRFLDAGYNVQIDNYDAEVFGAEFLGACETLRESIGRHWNQGIDDDRDCYVHDDYLRSRFLGAEICQERMLTPLLLGLVHHTISNIEPDYCVDVCNSWFVLKTDDGEEYPNFDVIVDKRQILIYTKSESLFKKLGIQLTENGKGFYSYSPDAVNAPSDGARSRRSAKRRESTMDSDARRLEQKE